MIDQLLAARVSAAPVWYLRPLTTSDHVTARGTIVEGQHAAFGPVPLVPQPVRFSEQVGDALTEETPYTPTLGQHTDQVLTEVMQLDSDAIAALKAKKAI